MKAIIFDCFGVLITDALSQIVADVHTADPAKAERILGLVHAASKGAIDASASRQAVAAELGISVGAYIELVRNGERRNEPLLRYIFALKDKYKTALLSNVSSGGLASRFSPSELARYFDAVVVSGDIGFAKPEAQAYEITASHLGRRLEDCIMIDDREDYCIGARGVGMKAIRYESVEQLRQQLEQYLRP